MGKPAVFKNIGRARSAYQEVVEQIRDGIFSGRFKLRDRLPTERELAVQFGLSRVVIREAIRTLELSGLVSVKKGAKGGIFVAQDFDRPIAASISNLIDGGEVTLENLFEVRGILEPHAAAKLATLGTEEEFGRLESIIQEARQARAVGSNLRPYNIRFHRLIMRMSKNPVLTVVGETVLTILTKKISWLVSPETSLFVLEKHEAIMDAIAKRNGDLVRSLMEEDIGSLGARFKEIRNRCPGSEP
jgi:GntR family transcriptional repressor for pyruvate dehydrogenase complex